jgi:hypothetical protein
MHDFVTKMRGPMTKLTRLRLPHDKSRIHRGGRIHQYAKHGLLDSPIRVIQVNKKLVEGVVDERATRFKY